MPKFMVETVSMFRMRYVIETESAARAREIVAENDGSLKEFSQLHLDEIIVSSRYIHNDEYLVQFDEDNDYLMEWTDEQKFKMVNDEPFRS